MSKETVAGIERIAAHRAALEEFDRDRDLAEGVLSPRSRVADLLSQETVYEMAARTRSQRPEVRESSFGDGVVTSFGEVGGSMIAVLADDPLAIAGSDGAVGKNKRIRMLMHANQGCLPIVYFSQSAVADGEAPAEGGLLGRGLTSPARMPSTYGPSRP